jgi:hypothetical protein
MLSPGFVIVNEADPATGFLRFVMTQLAPAAPKSGNGSLIVVRLKGKKVSGETIIDLLNVQMSSPDGLSILYTMEDGWVEVLKEQLGPTNTSMPTQKPGTPFPKETPTRRPRNTSVPTDSFAQATNSPTQPAPTTPVATVSFTTQAPAGSPTITIKSQDTQASFTQSIQTHEPTLTPRPIQSTKQAVVTNLPQSSQPQSILPTMTENSQPKMMATIEVPPIKSTEKPGGIFPCKSPIFSLVLIPFGFWNRKRRGPQKDNAWLATENHRKNGGSN